MILIMGQAGAGKSVQGEELVRTHGYEWVSTGALLRQELELDPDLKRRMEAGELLGDDVVERIVEKALLAANDPAKVILDGFPRNRDQFEWLVNFTREHGMPITCLLLIEIDYDTALERLLDRGRPDDQAEIIKRRFNEYQNATLPMIQHFEDEGLPVQKVNGRGTVYEVHERVVQALGL